MSNFTLENIILIFVFIVPGFITLDYIKSNVPFKRLSNFEATLYCLISSFMVNSFLFFIIPHATHFEKAKRFIESFIYSYSKINRDFHDLQVIFYFVFLYIVTSIVMATVFGAFHVWKIKRFKQNSFPVFLRIPPSKASKKIAFVKITMKNNKIYAGQLKYWPIDYDLAINSEKDIYIFEPYVFEDNKWNQLEADGIMLNTRDVDSTEFEFTDIENKS